MANVVCACGAATVIRTSWTSTNPGRRFYCCSRAVANCGFVTWADPPMCRRSIQIIPGLLRSINQHEEVGVRMATEIMWLKVVLIATWALIVLYIVNSNIAKDRFLQFVFD